MATHSSILAWEIPLTEEPVGSSPRGCKRVGRDLGTKQQPSHGDPTSLAPHERLTDLAVVPREKPHTGAAAREQPRDSPVIER